MSPDVNRGLRSSSVRQRNLSNVVRLLHLEGPTSRTDLVQRTGLTRSAISKLIAELVDMGLITERDPRPTGARGRPSPIAHAEAPTNLVVGIDLKVDSTDLTLVGLGGAVVGSPRRVEVDGNVDPGARIDQAITAMHHLVDQARSDGDTGRVFGIGIAVPGLVTQPMQRVALAPNLGWHDVDLRALVFEHVDADHVVEVTNEADVGAIAESRRGAARGERDVLFVSGEIGVGGGVIAGDHLWTGAHGYAGEIGHMPINPNGERCACGSIGCFETELGEAQLLRRAGIESSGRAGVDELLDRADQADATAIKALDEHARWLAFGLSSAIHLLDVRTIVLGGLLGRILPYTNDTLLEALANRSLVDGHLPTIVAAELGADAAARGAAERIWDRVLEDPEAQVERFS